MHIERNQLDRALSLQTDISQKHPRKGSVLLGRLYLECVNDRFTEKALKRTQAGIKTAHYDTEIATTLDLLRQAAQNRRCSDFSLNDSHSLFDAALQNPLAEQSPEYRAAVEYYRAHAFFVQGRLGRAMGSLERAYEATGEIEIRLTQVLWLARLGLVGDAQEYLQLARQHEGKWPWENAIYQRKMDRLQKKINEIRAIVESNQTTTGNNLD